MIRSWLHHSLPTLLGKVWLLLVLLPPPAAAAELEIDTGPGELGGISWTGARLHYQLEPTAGGRSWQFSLSGLKLAADLPAADLLLSCTAFSLAGHGPDCEAAELQLSVEGQPPIRLKPLRWHTAADGRVDVRWQGALEHAELRWSGGLAAAVLELEVAQLDLSLLPAEWLARLGLDVLAGPVWLDLRLSTQGLRGSLRWAEGALDGLEGRVAGEALELEVDLEIDLLEAAAPVWRLALRQLAGELLADSVYLPPPAAPLSLELDWTEAEPGRWRIGRFLIDDPDSLHATGAAEVQLLGEQWRLHSLRLDSLDLALSHFWQRWMEGPAAGLGFGGLEVEGSVSGSLAWRAGLLEAADLSVIDMSLDDPRGRVAVYGLAAHLLGEAGLVRSSFGWVAGRMWGLPLGATEFSLLADELGLRLIEPFSIPVFDGRLVIDSLAWLNLPELPSRLVLDARIEPISLDVLTRELGLIELGGTLAGHFPGVQYQDERLSFTGDIAIDAFSGRIGVSGLEVERPFGTLPALAAQVEFNRLDLRELTGAFDFGRMDGQMSGWMHDLRLLDWRPVAMDARLFTHEDVRRRRISQRAVDNLSSLGGGGSALLSGTVLRVFEDFPYQRAGLACRLSNNICYIDGVGPHASGGFYIVEGRGLPRLDVVGHRRLVDFPQLLRQLEAIRAQPDS